MMCGASHVYPPGFHHTCTTKQEGTTHPFCTPRVVTSRMTRNMPSPKHCNLTKKGFAFALAAPCDDQKTSQQLHNYACRFARAFERKGEGGGGGGGGWDNMSLCGRASGAEQGGLALAIS